MSRCHEARVIDVHCACRMMDILHQTVHVSSLYKAFIERNYGQQSHLPISLDNAQVTVLLACLGNVPIAVRGVVIGILISLYIIWTYAHYTFSGTHVVYWISKRAKVVGIQWTPMQSEVACIVMVGQTDIPLSKLSESSRILLLQ